MAGRGGAALAALAQRGCLRFNADPTVKADHTVDGSYVVAIEKGSGRSLGGSDDDSVVVSGPASSTQSDEAQDEGTPQMTVTIVFPSPVTSADGTINGNTGTWDLVGAPPMLEARHSAAVCQGRRMALLHLSAAGTSTSSSGTLILVSTLVFLAMVGTVGYIAWRNRKDGK